MSPTCTYGTSRCSTYTFTRSLLASTMVTTGCELVWFAAAFCTSAPGSMKRAVMVPSNGARKVS